MTTRADLILEILKDNNDVSSRDKCNKGTIPVDVVKRRRSRSETESTGMG